MIKTYNIESYKNTTDELILEIRELESLCNKHDNTHYQLFLENTLNEDRNMDFIFVYRDKGKIISMMLLFFPDIKEVKLYGFTNPDYRRNGLFTSLFNKVRDSFNTCLNSSYLFSCDQDSESGMNFINKMDTELKEIEYMMELDRDHFKEYINSKRKKEYQIKMEYGSMDQLNDISLISCSVYGEDNHKSSDFVSQTIKSDNKEQMIGVKNGKILGVCTFGTEDDFVIISGMGIDPVFQGKGYGRELLDQVLLSAVKKYKCSIKLEVSSINNKALNLYKSVGFIQNESYGYYRYN